MRISGRARTEISGPWQRRRSPNALTSARRRVPGRKGRTFICHDRAGRDTDGNFRNNRGRTKLLAPFRPGVRVRIDRVR